MAILRSSVFSTAEVRAMSGSSTAEAVANRTNATARTKP